MTELERMLKDTLTHMEQDVSAKLVCQGQTLEEQQRALTAQGRELQLLQEENNRISADLQALTRRLHDLTGLCASLEPLLTRLSGILNGR
jgi:chromosome segregation ATPase